MEQTNIRYVTSEDIPEKIQTVSIDVSFISLTKVLSPVRALCEEGASIVTLIKPQFEAGREKVGKKGVVRESATHIEVITKVITYALAHGFEFKNLSFSPIKGPEGNIEYLALFETAKGYEASEDDGTAPETGADEIGNIDISDEGSEMSVRDEELSVAPEIAKLIKETVEQAHSEL